MRFVLLAGCFLTLWTPSALAEESCDIMREEIMTLREPEFGTPSIWDTVYGKDGLEMFADFAPLSDGSVVAAGAYTKDKNDSVYHPLLVQIDAKRKVRWEVREDTKNFKAINRIIETPSGFAVVGDVKEGKRDGIYLATYSKEGKKIFERAVFEPGANLDAKAVVAAADGYIVAAQYYPSQGGEKGQYGIVYKLGAKTGAQVWRHAYTPGMQTVFHNIQRMKDGYYMLAGQLKLDDGRKAAWLLKLDERGAIQWQRTYTRGPVASLHAVAMYPNGDYLLSGQARPAKGDAAAWVMRADTTGNALWQRYYTGAYTYQAAEGITYEDGRASVLVDARAQGVNQMAHARLMTLSPRGYLLNAESYAESMGGRGLHMYEGVEGARVIGGYAQMDYSEATTIDKIEPFRFDGWIVSAVAPPLTKIPAHE